jgi:SnoaL-like domain
MALTDEQLQEMWDRQNELWDKQKIYENLMLYVRGVDRMDRELIRSAYWEDSTDDHGGFIGEGPKWADAAVSWKDKIYSNNHHASNVLIKIDGNRAERESMFINVVNLKEPAVSMFDGGRYRDLCEKRSGEWKILHRVCVWDWSETRPTHAAWGLVGRPRVTNWGAFYPDDPIYGDWTTASPTDFPRPDWGSPS